MRLGIATAAHSNRGSNCGFGRSSRDSSTAPGLRSAVDGSSTAVHEFVTMLADPYSVDRLEVSIVSGSIDTRGLGDSATWNSATEEEPRWLMSGCVGRG